MARGDIILKILEGIGDFMIGSADLLEAILNAGYGASSGTIQRELSKLQRIRYKRISEEERQKQIKEIKKRYRKFVSKLKHDGIIAEKRKNGKKFFILTLLGKKKWAVLKEVKNKKLPEISYTAEGGDKLIIVIFDIPEKEKKKRNWLREVLKKLNFKMLQKSVWIGKIKIPREFLDDLFKLKLIDFVEIFEISKTGSLKHIV